MITRLVRSEITRLLHRRRVVISIIALLAFSVVTPVMWMDSARPHSAQELEDARLNLALSGKECPECTMESFLRQVWSLEETVQWGVAPFIFLLSAVVLLTVIVYAGSDFSSGVISTQLTFTPRRRAVVLARATISSLYGGLLMLLAVGATSAVTMVWFVAMRGYADFGDTGPLLQLFVWGTLYGLTIGTAGTLLVVLCNGSTGAAAAVLALILGSFLLEALGPLLVPRWAWHLSPVRQVESFISGRTQVWAPEWTMTMVRSESVLFHSLALIVLLLVTLVIFERRDIKA